MTEDDARETATRVLRERYPEFASGEWVLAGAVEYESAWAFAYNSRQFVETHDMRHALAGNGALVVPKSGDEPWFTWSGADTAGQSPTATPHTDHAVRRTPPDDAAIRVDGGDDQAIRPPRGH